MIAKRYFTLQALCIALLFAASAVNAQTSNNGGGGGSFIVKQTGNVPLIIAGGGGGASGQCCGGQGNGAPGVTSTSGTVGLYTTSVFGAGGTGGNGGTAGNGGYSAGSGAGGGFSTDGGSASGNTYPYAADGGASFTNGGAGGLGALYCGGTQQVYGGFGGGGGAACFPGFHINGPGGGGGGYSGGAGTNGGSQWGAGGGGGSYNAGTSQANYDGSNTTFGNSGDGSVSITWAGGAQTFGKVHNTLQSFTVPAGVTSINIVAKGAQGGNADADPSLSYPMYYGGKGAYMSGTFSVTPGDVLIVLVGETPESYAGGTCGATACATPTAYTVTGGGAYCSGGSGVAIGLAGSQSGVTYQLYRSSTTAVGGAVSGTGNSITFGTQSVAGAYTVVATRTSGVCTNSMSNGVTVSINSLPSATAAVSPLYPMSGQEIQTIYLGYTSSSAQTESMSITAAGGNSSSYSYSWQRSNCNGSTMSPLMVNGNPVTASSYTFAPTAADICPGNGNGDNIYIFTATVTDGNGCTATATKKLNVVDPFVSGGNVQVCHKVSVRGGSTSQVMSLPPSQVATHLAHGDYLGNCPVFTGAKLVMPEVSEEQHVAVYPNPSTGIFILELPSVNEGATIMVTDVAGKLIAMKTLAVDVVPTTTFDLSTLAKGLYLIQVKDGEFNYRTKVVIQ